MSLLNGNGNGNGNGGGKIAAILLQIAAIVISIFVSAMGATYWLTRHEDDLDGRISQLATKTDIINGRLCLIASKVLGYDQCRWDQHN